MPQTPHDSAAWYSFHLEPHRPKIRSWLVSRYGADCDVEDVLQEAILKVIRTNDKTPLASPKAYFFAVARNLAVDCLRRKKVSPISDSVFDESAMDMVEDRECVAEVASRNHELEILTRAIQSLPERCRKVFTLSKVYGMTYNQIAQEMGISFNTVSAQIAIGLSKCTEYMNRYGRD